MSENKKYYYMKLKDNFYNTDDIKLLEAMPNGYEYSSFYLKLCLMSLKEEGRLVFKGRIPYKPEMLSTITGHNIDIIRVAIKILKDMEMISILDTGTIFINDIQALVGSSNSEADRKRKFRQKIKKEKALFLPEKAPENTDEKDQMGHSSGHRPPEIEKELEIRDKDKERNDSFSEKENVSEEVKKPKKKRKLSEKQKILLAKTENFIQKVINIYPDCKPGYSGSFINKDGKNRLAHLYQTKILKENFQTEEYFLENLKCFVKINKEYTRKLYKYVGTNSSHKGDWEEDWISEYNKQNSKTNNSGSRKNPQHHYCENNKAAQELKSEMDKAEDLWDNHGIQTPGRIFLHDPKNFKGKITYAE